MDVPDLDVPASGPAPVVRPPAKPAAPATPAAADDDVFGLGMEIERDISQPFQGPPSTAQPRAHRPRPSSSGLDVTYKRLDPRSTEGGPYRPSKATVVLGPLAAAVVAAAAFGGLAHALHRPTGFALTSLAPRAFDGTSVVGSGIVAVTALVLSIAIGYAGVRASSRSWLLVGTATCTMLLALAMVTVTLASSGEHGPPPDGALLVPWLAPFAIALAGLDALVRGARTMTKREGARKLGGVPLALAAGGLVFVALEASRFAALLPL